MVIAAPGGVLIDLHVIPRAAKPGIAGSRNNALLVRLSTPPVDGAANAELVKVLADALGVSKRNVTVIAGERSRRKRVRVVGITVEDVNRLALQNPD